MLNKLAAARITVINFSNSSPEATSLMLEHSIEGNKIEAARKHKKLSQAKLAEMIGVSRASISLYETGAGSPSYKVLSKLSAALEIPFGDLAGLGEASTRIPDSLYNFSYMNGVRSALIQQKLNRTEDYKDIALYGEPSYLAYLGIDVQTTALPAEENKPIEWPTVSVLMVPEVDYSMACVGIIEDNAMKPRYPKNSRHVFHPLLMRSKWLHLTGVYAFSIDPHTIIIRRIIANKETMMILADADGNELTIQNKDILMIWSIGQTIHMPIE